MPLAGPPKPSSPEPVRDRESLLAALRARCERPAPPTPLPALSLGLPEIDRTLPAGGLAPGAVHEWVGLTIPTPTPTPTPTPSPTPSPARLTRHWSPPLRMLIHLATRATRFPGGPGTPGPVIWIGERIWPCITALAMSLHHASSLLALREMLFIRAQTPADRAWAADAALRSRACTLVLADGAGFSMQDTRRLQLAAESAGAICVLARPPNEARALSASATRWLIGPHASALPPFHRRWTVELLRCKGLRPAATHGPDAPPDAPWVLEHDDDAHALRVVAHLRDRCGAPQADPPASRHHAPSGFGHARLTG